MSDCYCVHTSWWVFVIVYENMSFSSTDWGYFLGIRTACDECTLPQMSISVFWLLLQVHSNWVNFVEHDLYSLCIDGTH